MQYFIIVAVASALTNVACRLDQDSHGLGIIPALDVLTLVSVLVVALRQWIPPSTYWEEERFAWFGVLLAMSLLAAMPAVLVIPSFHVIYWVFGAAALTVAASRRWLRDTQCTLAKDD